MGFKGNLCEQNINDCLDDGNHQKCQNGGQCIDGINQFTCNCTETGKLIFITLFNCILQFFELFFRILR